MNTYGPLFDVTASKKEAADGMEWASSADRVQAWKRRAFAWLLESETGKEFSADDLILSVGLPDEGANKNNVVGAWINAQSKQHRITFTGRFQKSSRIDRHVGLQRIWMVK